MSTPKHKSPLHIKPTQAFRGFLSKYYKSTGSFNIEVPSEKIIYLMDRIVSVLDKGGSFYVRGDYDCDGILATSYMVDLITDVAKVLGYEDPIIDYTIPSRSEHYGIKYPIFQYLTSKYDLVIAVDNGTHKEFYKELTPDDKKSLAIVDHHPNGDFDNEDSKEVINPNKDGSIRISTGILMEVVFQAFRKRYRKYGNAREENHFRDYAAITAISDMADTNNPAIRKIIESGLELISKRERSIYKLLFPVFNGEEPEPLTIEDLQFNLIPVLNSVMRLAPTSQDWLVPLMLNREGGKVFDEYGRKAIFANLHRKELTNTYTKLAEKAVNIPDIEQERPNIALVVDNHNTKDFDEKITENSLFDTPIGLNGLIAGNIFSKHLVDTIMVSRNIYGDNMLLGSGRGSAIKTHLLELVKRYPEVSSAIEFGGHNAAIGIRILDLETFSKYLGEYNKKRVIFPDLENNHVVFNKNPLSLDDYKDICCEYSAITNAIPLDTKIFMKIEGYISSYVALRNNFIRVSFTDKDGDEMTFITKENSEIDYTSVEPCVVALAIKSVPLDGNDVVFTDMIPEKSVKAEKKLEVSLPSSIMTKKGF